MIDSPRKNIPRIMLLLLLGTVAVIYFSLAPAIAEEPPPVDPPAVCVWLPPGESVTIIKTVTVPVVAPKLDLLLMIDLTASYGDDLPNIRTLAPGIFDDVSAIVPDSQFGVASFMDFPIPPWGLAGVDYAY